jgi:hypothetical protein
VPHPRHVLLPVLLGLAATAVRAEVVDIAWGEQGRFERRLTVAPGKFAEVCGKLARDDSVAWRFEAGGSLNFNVHYHVGEKVHYPERREALAGASGRLQVELDQDYCWMWTNKSAAAVPLTLTLERRMPGR